MAVAVLRSVTNHRSCIWSPVTIPSDTLVDPSERSAVRSEPLVDGLAAHPKGDADVVPRGPTVVRFDDEPGHNGLQLSHGRIDPCGGSQEVVRA